MSVLLKKLQKKYASVKDVMVRWDELQSQLLTQFGNATSIINRLKVLRDDGNYGALAIIPGIKDALLAKQIKALETTFISMKDTMKEFHSIVMTFDKIERDAGQLLRGSTPQQMQLCVGKQPSLQQCLDGLSKFHEMHKSECHLKNGIISTLSVNYLKFSENDVAVLGKILGDQPNILKDEVQTTFEIILPADG